MLPPQGSRAAPAACDRGARFDLVDRTRASDASDDPVGLMLDRQPDRSDRAPASARSIEAEEAFLAVLSHELRTPITTIYAGSSVLARRRGLSPAATRTLAVDISAEAARLYDLVEDLLVLARLERRVLDPLDEPVLVRRSVDSTIRMI